jgi:hypothetical protein
LQVYTEEGGGGEGEEKKKKKKVPLSELSPYVCGDDQFGF